MKHFLIVGGTRGIGWSLAKRIVSEGESVSVFGRRPTQNSDRILQYEVDVLETKNLVRSLDLSVKALGPISSVVFLQRARGGDLKTQLDVSVFSSRVVVEHLKSSLESVVFVSSIADNYIASEQDEGYHICKSALGQLARWYAFKLAPIRVNTVSPCVVIKDPDFKEKNPELSERFNKFIPLGRPGTCEDISEAIIFLCRASYVTGQNLVVDGGLTLISHESILRTV